MKPIHVQVSITLEDETVSSFGEFIHRIVTTTFGVDDQRESRLRESKRAQFSGQKRPEDKGLLIDTNQAAKLLQVSPRTLWKMYNSGEMPKPIRIGRAVRWSYDGLRAWVNAGCPPSKA